MAQTLPATQPFGRPRVNVLAQCTRCLYVEGYDYEDALTMTVVNGQVYIRHDPQVSILKEIHNPKRCGGKFKYFCDRRQFIA